MPVCTNPECVDGWVEGYEDGRAVRTPCYHCGNTGAISEEQLYDDRVLAMAEGIAARVVASI